MKFRLSAVAAAAPLHLLLASRGALTVVAFGFVGRGRLPLLASPSRPICRRSSALYSTAPVRRQEKCVSPPPPPVPDKSTLLSSLNRLARLSSPSNPSAASDAQALLDSAEAWYQAVSGGSASTVVVDAAVHGSDKMEGVVIGPVPGVASYLSVIEAWCAIGSEEGADKARAVLARMYELANMGATTGSRRTSRKIRPNRAAHARVLAAYADVGRGGAAEKAEALLGEMLERGAGRRVAALAAAAVADNTGSTNNGDEEEEREKTSDAAVQQPFVRIDDEAPENPLCRPDTGSFNLVMKAWSNTGGHGSGRRAEALLDKLEYLWSPAFFNSLDDGDDRSHYYEDDTYKPNHVSYTTAITAWARSNEGGRGARRGERLLERMEAWNRVGEHSLRPTAICVNAVLNAWAKSHKRGSADRAELILTRMEDLYTRGGRDELRPTAVSYNTVISARARSGERGAERRAELVLRRMDALATNETTREAFAGCAPDIVSYNSVINAWARSGERNAARRAEAILRHMDRHFAASSASDPAPLVDGDSEPTPVPPDVTSYTSVVNAWARSGEASAAADRADAIVRRMEDISAPGGSNPSARPNTLTYNSLLNAWAKSDGDPRAARRAVEILRRMEGGCGADPDVYTYTSAIDALARSSSSEPREAAERAELILDKMERRYEETGDESIRPNVRTYTSVVSARARSGDDPEKAEAILKRMETLASTGQNTEARPDVVSYNAMLNAWARSSRPDKAHKALALYDHMLEQYDAGGNRDARPDLISLNMVLNACAFTDPSFLPSEADRAAVLDVCIRTAELVRERDPELGRPNSATYATILKTIGRMLPPCNLRAQLARGAFEQCADAGRVNGLVLSSLLRALNNGGGEGDIDDDSVAQDILGEALLDERDGTGRRKFDVKRLPGMWTRYAGGGGGGAGARSGGGGRGRGGRRGRGNDNNKRRGGSPPSRGRRTSREVTKSAATAAQRREKGA